MTDAKKAASLNPADARTELIIDNLLGPGVTIIGSEEPMYRYVIQQQMGISIAKGEKFLGIVDTQKSEVLYVADGTASYEEVTGLGDNTGVSDGLHIYFSWDRIEQGGILKLQQELKRFPRVRVAFLGDFEEIRSFQVVWRKNYLKRSELQESQDNEEKTQGTNDPFSNQAMKRVMARDNINRLKSASWELETGIVIGEDLNTRRRLHNWDGLRYRNNEVHIYKSSNNFKLEVRPGGNVLPESWDLYFDNEKRLFLPIGDFKPEARKSQAQELSLLENERAIIDALGNEFLPASKIADITHIPRPTVYQRLDALQDEKKGRWILSLIPEGEGPKQYFVNPDKQKDKDW
jgi:hypothetical protein